jgi:hypothetical protein
MQHGVGSDLLGAGRGPPTVALHLLFLDESGQID